jgi:hypothetical protein
MVPEPLFHIRAHLGFLAIFVVAMTSSSSTPTLTHQKLTHDNFTLWKPQVIPAIRVA